MFHPGLTELFKTLVVTDAAAHGIEVLRDNWVVSIRQLKRIDRLRAVVTRSRSHSQPDKASVASELLYGVDRSNNNIRPLHQCRRFAASCASQWRQYHRLRFAVNEARDLHRLHRRSARNFSNGRT